MNIFLAPHSDDEALFGTYIINRTKARVVVVTDGTSHLEKFGVKLEERRNESREAMKLLGVETDFLRIGEEDLTADRLKLALSLLESPDRVFAPAQQGGHYHHDLVSSVAKKLWGDRVLYYSTYSEASLTPTGEIAIYPKDEAEEQLKQKVLACYTSQLRINPHHFEAVRGFPEYLNFHA